MMNIKIPKNPYILFSPFLLIYVVFVLKLHTNDLWGDEIRHFAFANNIIHGFYSLPEPNTDITCGPGYPLLIAPFIALNIPFLVIKLLNAVFLYLSIIFLFKTLIQFVSFRKAVLFSLFWGCYYTSLEFMALMYSETFMAFLVSLLVLFLVNVFNENNPRKTRKYIFLSGFIIGYIALTKIIFGYVLLFMLVGSGLLWIRNRYSVNYRKGIIVLLIAFATVTPYLVYTYHLTGRIFYWGTSGGNNLYWMTSPYEDEYGSWFSDPNYEPDSMAADKVQDAQKGELISIKNRTEFIEGSEDSIKKHHQKDYEEIDKYTGIKRDENNKRMVINNVVRDDAFKRIAIRNIKSYPAKYIQNCISNIGRILFNYPYSYTLQKPGTLVRFPLNGIIVVLMLFCLIPTLLNWRKIIYPIRFMLFFAFLYLGGSVLVCSETRMFTIVVPILLFWIAFIIQKSMKISDKFVENNKQ